MTAEPVLPNPRDAALQFAVTKAVADHATAAMKTLREDANQVFMPGDRLVVTSPLDRRVRIGTVTATDPEDEAVVVDEAAFTEWMTEHHGDQCETTGELIGSTWQVVAAILNHCPPDVADSLVRTSLKPTAQARNAVLKLSAKAGVPVGPGGEVDGPPGIEIRQKPSTVQVRLAEDAMDTVFELWQQRAVEPLRALGQ